MKRKGWKKKLNRAELAHIKATTNGGLLSEFKANRAKHHEWIAKGEGDACIECRMIALKLGIERHATALERVLQRLVEKVKRANEIQHSGGPICAEDWGELFHLTNEAEAALRQTAEERGE